MKIKFKYIASLIILILTICLIAGHYISKKNSNSKRNEIFNLTKQLISRNQQIYKIQRNLKFSNQNIHNFLNPNEITFKKIVSNKSMKNIENNRVRIVLALLHFFSL